MFLVIVSILALYFAWMFVSKALRMRRYREIVAGFRSEVPKKILCVCGSPKKNGSTGVVLDHFRAQVEKLVPPGFNVSVEIVNVNDLNLGQCVGCGNCILGRTCPLREGYSDFLEHKMLHCDALVLASSVYVGSVPGEMKKFLDRWGALFHRPALVGIPALSIAVAATWWHSETAKFLEVSTEHIGCLSVGRLALTSFSLEARLPDGADKKLEEAALSLLAHIAMPKTDYVPSWGATWAFAIHRVGARFFEADRVFWEEHGWSDRSYFYPCKLSLPKRLFSMALTGLLGLLPPPKGAEAKKQK